jgi:MATE family multidrug resistance protein
MKRELLRYWDGAGGGSEILKLALPLILSTSVATVQMFTDRMFLMWYDVNAMSAAMQGGITSFTAMALFLGITGYVNTFVAQYTGAGRPKRVGPSVWQGIYLATASGVVMVLLVWVADWLFGIVGHTERLRAYEVTYFQIMCIGAWPGLLGSALSCFFMGRGRMWPVMWIDLGSCLMNVVLDYGMIFGHWGFPAWGLAGAAWATVISQVARAAVYFVMFLSRDNDELYASRHGWRLEWVLIKRMVRYGLPNGVQFSLDVMAFSFFLAIVGRMGEAEFAATSLVFQLNHLAFMPMVGMGTAVTVLVGQRLGENKPEVCVRTTWIAGAMCFVYMAIISVGYVTIPDVFLYPFSLNLDATVLGPLHDIAVKLLWFVAFYSLFDTGNIIFASTLKGAGDTRFVMIMSVGLGWVLLVIPAWLVMKFGWGLYTAWGFATAYVSVLAVAFMARVINGKWKEMRVIEKVVPIVPPAEAAIPTIGVDMP